MVPSWAPVTQMGHQYGVPGSWLRQPFRRQKGGQKICLSHSHSPSHFVFWINESVNPFKNNGRFLLKIGTYCSCIMRVVMSNHKPIILSPKVTDMSSINPCSHKEDKNEETWLCKFWNFHPKKYPGGNMAWQWWWEWAAAENVWAGERLQRASSFFSAPLSFHFSLPCFLPGFYFLLFL